jgi:hypothetical protein
LNSPGAGPGFRGRLASNIKSDPSLKRAHRNHNSGKFRSGTGWCRTQW